MWQVAGLGEHCSLAVDRPESANSVPLVAHRTGYLLRIRAVGPVCYPLMLKRPVGSGRLSRLRARIESPTLWILTPAEGIAPAFRPALQNRPATPQHCDTKRRPQSAEMSKLPQRLCRPRVRVS